MTEQEQKRRERALADVIQLMNNARDNGEKVRFSVSIQASTEMNVSGTISIPVEEGDACAIIDILSGQDDRYWDLSREQIHGLVALVDAERERQEDNRDAQDALLSRLKNDRMMTATRISVRSMEAGALVGGKAIEAQAKLMDTIIGSVRPKTDETTDRTKLDEEHAEACRRVIAYGSCFSHDDIICCYSGKPTDGKTTFKCPGDKWDCNEKVAEATAWLIAHGFDAPKGGAS